MTHKTETTERGLRVYARFDDTRGNRVRVQDSSAASEPHVWIFCEWGGVSRTPHLNVEQAKAVRAALDAFIEEDQ